MNVLSAKSTLEQIMKEFRKRKVFSFTRFGDGDMKLMDGAEGKESNQWNSEAFQKELIEAFQITDPNYLIGSVASMQNEENDTLCESTDYTGLFVKYPNGPSSDEAMQEIAGTFSKRDVYCSPVVFHFTAVYHPEVFMNFVQKYIWKKEVIFVGGEHLRRMPLINIFNIKYFVNTPSTQAYEKIDKFYKKIIHKLEFDIENKIILFAVGHTTRILQKRIWQSKYRCTMLDIGSLSDALVGLENNRGWIKPAKENINRLLEICKVRRKK